MTGTTCGLPNPYFLAAPTATLATGLPPATFSSPGYNQTGALTTFVGFEIYYKFLSSTPGGTDINLGGGGFPGPSILQQNGYMPVCLATDNPPLQRTAPAIAIAFADSVNPLSISVNFDPHGAWFSSYGSTPELRRNISYSSPPQAKTFANDESQWPNTSLMTSNYLPGDNDLQSIVSAGTFTTSNQAFVNLYVLAYGFEQGTSIVQYSTPTYMGYIIITPFP